MTKQPLAKPRYNFLEGVTDWLSAYMISGTIAAFVGGGLWVLIGVAILIIILLAFMMYRPKAKFRIYVMALALYVAALISLIIRTGNQPLNALWVMLLVLGFTQAVLTVRYYHHHLKAN